MRRRTSRAAPALAAVVLLAQAPAVLAAPLRFDVAAGPLEGALQAYAEQTGVDVLFAPQAVAGRRSRGGRAVAEPEEALKRLLKGSGLTARRIGPRAFAVAPAAPSSRMVDRTPEAREPAKKVEGVAPLDAVLVQARRREERLIDVPASVAAVSAADLERLGGDGMLALRQAALGLTAAGQVSVETPTLVIRGQRRATAGDSALSVITYVNEAPLPNNGSILPSFDLAEVQVLRGPQGVLFGRNTTGGALLIQTNEPGRVAYARIATGSYRLREIEAAADLTDGRAPLAARLAVYGLKRDGLVENLGVGGDLDDRDQVGLRLSLAWKPQGPLSALLVLDGFRAWETGSAAILSGTYPNPPDVTGGGNGRMPEAAPYFDCGAAGCDIDIALARQRARGIRATDIDLPPRSDRRNDGATLRLDWREGGLDVRSVTAYRRSVLDSALDSDGSPLPLNQLVRHIDLGQFTQEVRASRAGQGGAWQAGLFYMSTAPVGVQRSLWASVVTPSNPARVEFQYRRGESLAGFVDATRRLGAGFELEAGLRYTRDVSSACLVRVAAPVADISEAACGEAGRAQSSAPTWTLGLTWRGRPNLTLYAVTRRGYRAGGVNAPNFGPLLEAYQVYAPESLTDLELGLKWVGGAGDWRHRVDAALFRGWSRDIQRALFPAENFDGDGIAANDPPSLIINAGSARISGLELGWRGQRGRRLTLSASATLTQARFTTLTVPALLAGLTPTDPASLRFSYSPPYTARLAADWLAVDSERFGRWTLWADVFQSGRVRYVERARDSNGMQGAFAVAGAGLAMQPAGRDDLTLSLAVRNLFDEVYAAGGGAITPAVTATSLIYGEPRTIEAAVRRRF